MGIATVELDRSDRDRELHGILYSKGFYVEKIGIVQAGNKYIIKCTGDFPGGQEALDSEVQIFRDLKGPSTLDISIDNLNTSLSLDDIKSILVANGFVIVSGRGLSLTVKHDEPLLKAFDIIYTALAASIGNK